MILPIEFLWRQLNGPQATGIMQAIYNYWKDLFDDKLDYFNNLTIDIGNNSHLTFIGTLIGFIRPTVVTADEKFFYFSSFAEHDSDTGFSDLDNMQIGGEVAGLDTGRSQRQPLIENYYRALLRSYVETDSELNSLKLLDEICYKLTLLDSPGNDPFYEFTFEDGSIEDRAPGDIYIDLGSLAQWKHSDYVYAVINSLSDTTFSPVPKIWPEIRITD